MNVNGGVEDTIAKKKKKSRIREFIICTCARGVSVGYVVKITSNMMVEMRGIGCRACCPCVMLQLLMSCR